MTGNTALSADASTLAEDILSHRLKASEVGAGCLARIDQYDPLLNCFTEVFHESALKQALEIDRRIAGGENPGPLAGIPFAVKNLFDVAGVTTLAGSKTQ